MVNLRQDVSRIYVFSNYTNSMFPYNDEKLAWINKRNTSKIKPQINFNHTLVMAFFLTLFISIFPFSIYFLRLYII